MENQSETVLNIKDVNVKLTGELQRIRVKWLVRQLLPFHLLFSYD